ncbi:MAG: hypothetical protein PHT02_12360, partial [Tissierellia bacterium]|nr:hypothetical protein [Tissierellia bacterium]
MRIQHNLNAMNSLRQLGTNNNATGKNLEKLSSGYRINRAGDDAAGLAISEKMRAQIRGLEQASANAEDGISLIQTAEGALNETTSIIQRLRELSVQASNDTNTADDKVAIQKEVEQLKEEIDRIGNTTEFNTTKLIDGSIGVKKAPGVDNAAVISSSLGKETAAAADSAADVKTATFTPVDGTLNLQIDGAKIDVAITATEYAGFDDATNVDTKSYAAKLQEDINKAISDYNKAHETNIANVTVSAATDQDGTISIKSGTLGSTSTVDILANAASAGLGLTADATTNIKSVGTEGIFSAAGAAQVTAIAADAVLTMNIDGTDIQVDLAAVGAATYTDDDDMTDLATDL